MPRWSSGRALPVPFNTWLKPRQSKTRRLPKRRSGQKALAGLSSKCSDFNAHLKAGHICSFSESRQNNWVGLGPDAHIPWAGATCAFAASGPLQASQAHRCAEMLFGTMGVPFQVAKRSYIRPLP